MASAVTPRKHQSASLMAEAHELLRRQRSEDRNIAGLHAATEAKHEALAKNERHSAALVGTLGELAATIGADAERLRAADETELLASLNEAERERASVEERVAALNVDLEEASKAESDAVAALETQKERAASLQTEVRDLQAKLSTADDGAAALAAVRESEAELATLQANFGALQQQLKEREALLAKTQRETAAIEESINQIPPTADPSTAGASVLDAASNATTEALRLPAADNTSALMQQLRAKEAIVATIKTQIADMQVQADAEKARLGAALGRRKRILDAIAAQDAIATIARYRAEISAVEAELRKRPTAEELPSRVSALETQVEKLCVELNGATEDLQLLQGGHASQRLSEMQLAHHAYANETIPEVRRQLQQLRADAHNAKVEVSMWGEERARHENFMEILQEDIRRMRVRVSDGYEKRKVMMEELGALELEELRMRKQRAIWREEDAELEHQIEAQQQAQGGEGPSGGGKMGDLVEVVEDRVEDSGVRTTHRRVVIQPKQPDPVFHVHPEAAVEDKKRFGFLTVNLFTGLIRAWRRTAGVSSGAPMQL